MELVALLPMRHESERVPGKNYRDLAGRPLFTHVLEVLLETGCFDRVVIDTDSPRISDILEREYPSVARIDRPEELRGGHVPMNEVLLHDVRAVPARAYLQTHSTNPFLRTDTVRRAVELFLGGRDEHDSLFSVTPHRARFWSGEGAPVNHDPRRLERTQDLPPLFEENSSMFLFGREGFLETGNRIGARPRLFPMHPVEALDIDTELDFRMAELLSPHLAELLQEGRR